MNFIIDRTMPKQMQKKLSEFGSLYLSTIVGTEDKSISTHPDLQIHFVTDNMAFCSPDTIEHYTKILPKNIKLKAGCSNVGGTYPSSCAYNIARIGNIIICNTECADKAIMDFYKETDKEIINVKQGYSKCNICPISDTSFITEDRGIHNSIQKDKHLTSHLIEVGSVSLDGFKYGFIGGATGVFDNKILFCGKIPDGETGSKIHDIIYKENMEYVELSDDKLQDFGSIISFK